MKTNIHTFQELSLRLRPRIERLPEGDAGFIHRDLAEANLTEALITEMVTEVQARDMLYQQQESNNIIALNKFLQVKYGEMLF